MSHSHVPAPRDGNNDPQPMQVASQFPTTIMSTTPSSSTPVSSVRRFKQVYVEIPPSPLHTSRRLSIPSVPSRLFSSNVNRHKGNTPVQHSISKHAAIPSQKRKGGSSSLQLPIKKPRIEHMNEVGRGIETELFIRCHDCRAKRHPSGEYDTTI